ncbi:sugar transferase [Acidimangrovimonas sediminis]|uniref:sugar transferase n=1 Tax=Acidimangrovimonas sediminis TaxID=2056283 RepID=UPI000C80FDCB|nr:sugar transferase [Acidimangrovimonas sediminis]
MSDVSEPRVVGARLEGVSAPIRALFPAIRDPRDPVLKRVVDRFAAVVLIVFFLPFLVTVALALKLTEGGPILFAHERVGLHGRRFRCLKFRTMVPDAEARLQALLDADPVARREWEATRKLTDDPRISCLGHLLRRTSLDELPQLFNVLRGDMSLVGPRPVTIGESRFYGRYFADYQSARPGVTGLWQVMGRSDTSYQRRVAMDVTYVRNISFGRDVAILWRTAHVVLARKGAR